ncbi:ubiquitin carboxyl-terminal hydrolase 10 [Nephila pilipes]|uniref:ubiquitinyl hydrolase 1 n=1 Tax=Nephila pilipes TaxID=299642 RepID=A0A8X6UC12_NEPPI|nr:ubiquitin carboxyl-terminal hydrolase 10 [Nephila pilipes]GFU15339.1 ubiquitin carboxyl-terminal hydrolase 10 [Nephila pilipes]
MEMHFGFLNFDGLDDIQVRYIKDILHPFNRVSVVEFPWDNHTKRKIHTKGNISSLNVHAPAFESHVPLCNNHVPETELYCMSSVSYSNRSNLHETAPVVNSHYYTSPNTDQERTLLPAHQKVSNGQQNAYDQNYSFSQPPKPFSGDFYSNVHETQQIPAAVSTFKLNPTVSSFVPQNMVNYHQPNQPLNGLSVQAHNIVTTCVHENQKGQMDIGNETLPEQNVSINNFVEQVDQNSVKQTLESVKSNSVSITVKDETANAESSLTKNESAAPSKPGLRSWADVVSRGPKPEKVPPAKPVNQNKKTIKVLKPEQEKDALSIAADKMSLILGKHLHNLKLNFQPVLLQPRGLINRRNWCYINASLQALLGCSPFYTLLRDLPLGPGVDRGKSSTPVIDSMVKVTYEFSKYDTSQEELVLGLPFQPDFIYDMLRDLKSDCLKGQQEDAEEVLSFILNGMHEEMVKIIKNYEKNANIKQEEEMKENGDVSDGEEEWQVIGSKHKGMVTRKVAEHKTPISDLFGGQIKSFLTTSGSKTSASIQPFFTLQLDIQSESVNSVSEALKEMTVKEPIQGYTCAKTKQEVEAFSHVALQKLPPILILHLKRFVYNKNGGCKKVMKKTDYPLILDISKDIFSSDFKKSQRLKQYKLFAVMYHDGEEAIKGHYISDVYNHGNQTWIRCDDRSVTAVTEDQVLSYSPPRVPYLLFYQES